MSTNISGYSDLLPYMAVDLPGNPAQAVMLNALRRAGRDFCETTEAWLIELDPINLVADQKSYTITIPNSATIYRIDEVRLNTEDGVDAGNDAIKQDSSTYEFIQPSTLKFKTAPAASVTDGLEVDVIIVPPIDFQEDFDEWFMERWHEAILDGAMYLMLMQVKKPWSNPAGAAEYKMRFRTAMNRAKAERSKKYVEKVSCFTA